jgi:hypothetical protein
VLIPSTVNNSCGICKDASRQQLVHLHPQRIDHDDQDQPRGWRWLQATILDFFMFAPPNGSDIKFRLVNAVDGTVYVDDVSISTNLPTNTTFMYAWAGCMSTVGHHGQAAGAQPPLR